MKRTSACKHSIIMHSVGITSLYNRHYNLTADGSFIETELVWHQAQKSSQSSLRPQLVQMLVCLFVSLCGHLCTWGLHLLTVIVGQTPRQHLEFPLRLVISFHHHCPLPAPTMLSDCEESQDDVCHLEPHPFIIAPPGCATPAASCRPRRKT